MRALQLLFGLDLDARINRESDVVSFVNGRRLELLFGEAVPGLQRDHLQAVSAFDDFVELVL